MSTPDREPCFRDGEDRVTAFLYSLRRADYGQPMVREWVRRCLCHQRVMAEKLQSIHKLASARNMANDQRELQGAGATLLLHTEDNVVVCRRAVFTGEVLLIDGCMVTARTDVDMGHKVARSAIPEGSRVVKYGMSIGISTSDIQPGDWVHCHNMKSEYIPSHTRESQRHK